MKLLAGTVKEGKVVLSGASLLPIGSHQGIAIVTARVRSSIGSKQHAEPDTGARSIPLEAFDFDHQPAKGRCAENTPPSSPLLAG